MSPGRQPIGRVLSVIAVVLCLAGAHPAHLAAQGRTIPVATEPELQAAMRQIASNTTIALAPGTYRLTNTLYVDGAFSNVAIRGATGNRSDVILQGPGMRNANYGSVPFGIWTGGGVNGIAIANLTIRDVYFHSLVFNAGTQRPHVSNVHLIDAGEQFIKSNPSGSGGVNDGIVESSLIEYSSEARSDYTNGVDVHTGQNWVIRNNVFRNITASAGLAGPAVLMWNGSGGTLTERNLFVNCARGIHYGLIDRPGVDHSGGIIRNNIFFRSATQRGDVGIGVFDSPGTQVLNNTIFVSGTYATPIEYRFAGASGVVLANNLLDGVILRRDGAAGTERNTLARAPAGFFVDAAGGDLHLAPGSPAIDAGVSLDEVTDDWDGDQRPQGGGADVGADEAGSRKPAAVSVLLFSKRKCVLILLETKRTRHMAGKRDVQQGTLALMVLKTLDVLGPLHGYGIARRIEQISGDLLAVNQGTLYPLLLKLEHEGAIASESGISDNNRKARFYRLTRAGRKQLQAEARDWEQMAALIGRFFEVKAEDLG